MTINTTILMKNKRRKKVMDLRTSIDVYLHFGKVGCLIKLNLN